MNSSTEKNIADSLELLTVKQLLFIDSQVENYQFLAFEVIPGVEVTILQKDRDGIAQISEVLQSQSQAINVHIVSHGSPGCLYLGNSQLSLDTLDSYTRDLKTWFSNSSFIPHPSSLLIYGCNVAAGDAGEEFIAKLHDITGAEVAASTTRIGNAAKGGDWQLDYQTGKIATEIVFNRQVQRAYAGVLVDVNIDNNTSGAINGNTTTANPLVRTFEVTDDISVDSISLGFNASHPWRGDIQAVLQSPNGTRVTLIASDANEQLDNYDFLLQNGGATLINDGNNDNTAAPIYGADRTASPSNPFSAFVGESAIGTWRLEIADTFSTSDDGTFNSAQLNITGNPPPLLLLDSDGSSGAGSLGDYINSLLDNGLPVNIADSDVSWDGTNLLDSLTFNITGVQDGGAEVLTIGGTDFALNANATDTVTVGNTTFNVAVSGNGSAFAITNAAGGSIPTADAEALLSGTTYSNTASNITFNNRIIDVTGIDTNNDSYTVTSTVVLDDTPSLTFRNPTLESGTDLQVGSLYRVANIVPGVDALIEVSAFNNGAVLNSMVPTIASGTGDSFEPEITAAADANPTDANTTTDSSVDFTISFVKGGSSTPVALNNFNLSAVDIDGNGSTTTPAREYVELQDFVAYTVQENNELNEFYDPATGIGRFEAIDESVDPSINLASTGYIATAEYGTVTTFTYRAGVINSGDAIVRQFSLNGEFSLVDNYQPPVTSTVSNPPIATDNSYTTVEGTTISGNIIADNTGSGIDSDPDGDALDVLRINGSTANVGSQIVLDSGGLLTVNPNGTFDYTPQGSFSGVETFTYTISDGTDVSHATVTIDVAASNLLPNAVPDTNTATEGATAVTDNVLTGDDLGDEPTTVTSADQGGVAITLGTPFTTEGGGSLTLNSDGSYSYTPPADGSVPTSGLTEVFNYTITDADGDPSSTTLTIDVVDSNLLPNAVPDTNTATEAGTAVTDNVLTDDALGDEPTTVTSADQGGVAITLGTPFTTDGGGTLTLNSDGTYSYTPPAQGEVPTGGLTEVFNYTITDANGDPSSTTLTIDVADNNLLPNAVPDTNTATEGSVVVADNVLTDDALGDAPTTVTAADQGGVAITLGTPFTTSNGGTLTLNNDGTYSYTPPAEGSVPNAGLTEVFNYTISDANGDTSSTTLTIDVANNTPPAIDLDADDSTDACNTGGVNASNPSPVAVNTINANYVDVDDSSNNYTAPGFGGNASYSTGTNYNLSFSTATTANNNLVLESVEVNGVTMPIATQADNVFIRRADNANVSGDVEFIWFQLEEHSGSTDTTAEYSPEFVSTIEESLNSPIINRGTDNAFDNVSSGQARNNIERIDYIFSDGLQAALIGEAGFTIVERNGNDDIKIAAITAVDVDGNPTAFGTLTNVPRTAFGGNAGQFRTTTFRDTDTTAGINLRPNSDIGSQTVKASFVSFEALDVAANQTIYGYTLFGNDVNPSTPADLLDWTNTTVFPQTTGGANGGSDLIGGGSFVASPECLDAVHTFTEGDNPITVGDSDAFVTDNGENDLVSLQIVVDPALITEGANEIVSIAGQPVPLNADASFNDISVGNSIVDLTYTAATGTFTIVEGNDPANVIPQADLNTLVEGIAYQNTSSNPTEADRTFSFTVTDATNLTSEPAVSTITVVAVNDLPNAVPDTNTATEAGTVVTDNVLTDDALGDEPTTVTSADQGGVAITLGTPFTTSNGGSITLNSDGSYSYTPPAQGEVPDGGLVEVFNYTITDENGDSSSTTLTIDVADNNLLPTANPDTNTATEGATVVTDNVLTDDALGDEPTTVTSADQNGTAITLGTPFTTDGGGSITLNSDGTYSYTPPAQGDVPTQGLVEVFNYTITDENGDTSTTTLTIDVADNNLVPTANPDTNSATEAGAVVSDNVLTGDDLGDEPTTVTSAEQGGVAITLGTAFTTDGGGSLTLNSDGTYSYTPPAQGEVPSDGLTEVFNYTITDENGDSSSTTLIGNINSECGATAITIFIGNRVVEHFNQSFRRNISLCWWSIAVATITIKC